MEEELISIGLSKSETKVYLCLIQEGETTATIIAKKSKIYRTNVYDSLKGLVEKGLVSYIQKEKTKFYRITDTINLLNIVKEKEENIIKILPRLKQHSLKEEENNSEMLEGLNAAKRVLDNFLTYNKPIYVMGVSSKAGELIKPFLTNFHKRRINKGIEMYHIYNTDAISRIKVLKKMKHTFVRILPLKFNSPVATNIVGDEITLIYWQKNAIIIRIKNKKLAQTYRNYFKLMWENAKKA